MAKDFNPHSREGSDTDSTGISPKFENFNPHSREGSDVDDGMSAYGKLQFQSTLPRRE